MRSPLHNILPDAAFRRLSEASALVFDVDRTLADPHEKMSEEMVRELGQLSVPVGVATARTLAELEASLPNEITCADIFTGDLLLEDGGVLVSRGRSGGAALHVEALVTAEELRAVALFTGVLREAFVDLNRDDGYGRFGDLREPLVRFPPFSDLLTSITIWEKGPVGDPVFTQAYCWVQERLKEHGLDELLALTEVGDGTLRVTAPRTNKGWGLQELARRGRLNLSGVAYFGDGFNDVPAAVVVKEHGGMVIAVGSSSPALLSLADFVTTGEGPESVAKILRRLNRIVR